jgi:hypothetical protein
LLLVSFGNDEESGEPAESAEDEIEHAEEAEPAPASRPAPPRKAALPRPSATSSDGLNVVGPHPDDPHEPGMHPHPITPEHERIYAENRLIQELNDLMSFRKVKEMREKITEYQKLDPQDIEKNQLGYEVIADCIEFPGDASLAAARHFYDTQRHSPLRRFVRRICFENSN